MKDNNLIHVKFEYEDAVKSKRDILLSERGLLRAAKTAKSYHSLRMKEIKIKIKLYREIRELIMNINKAQRILPRVKVPEILKKEKNVEEKIDDLETEIKKERERQYNDDIESQLQEIQDRLNALG